MLNKSKCRVMEQGTAIHSAGANSLKLPEDRAYVLMSTVPPPQSATSIPSLAYHIHMIRKLGGVAVKLTYVFLDGNGNLVQAKVKTRLAFSDKGDSFRSFRSGSDQSRTDCRTTHFGLLFTFPSIGVTEDKLYVCSNRFPYVISLSFTNILLCRFIHVLQNVAEDVNNRLVPRKRRYIFVIEPLFSNKMGWSEM